MNSDKAIAKKVLSRHARDEITAHEAKTELYGQLQAKYINFYRGHGFLRAQIRLKDNNYISIILPLQKQEL